MCIILTYGDRCSRAQRFPGANEFSRVVGRAEHAGEITIITNHGRRVAAVVPVDVLDALERLEDEALTNLAPRALAEPGEPIPHDQVLAELGLA